MPGSTDVDGRCDMKNTLSYIEPYSVRVESDQVEVVQKAAHRAHECRREFVRANTQRAECERKRINITGNCRWYTLLLPFTWTADTLLGYSMLVGIVPDPIAWLLSLFMGAGAMLVESVSADLYEKSKHWLASAISVAFGLMARVDCMLPHRAHGSRSDRASDLGANGELSIQKN